MRSMIMVTFIFFASFHTSYASMYYFPSGVSEFSYETTTNLTKRIDNLESQFQIVRDYSDDFLSVVLWSLTTIISVTVVLLGLNWFQSSRALKRELESIKLEIESSQEIHHQQALRKISEELDNLKKQINTEATKAADSKLAGTKEAVKQLERRVSHLEYSRLDREVNQWIEDGVLSNAFTTCGDLIKSAIKLHWDWQLSDAIDQMNVILKKIEEDDYRHIETQDILEVEAKVEKIPDTHKTARKALLSSLEALQHR